MSTASTLLNSNMPRDLRGGGPAEAGAGKTYDVDPAAVERLKRHIAARQAAAPVTGSQTAVPAVRRPKPAEVEPVAPEAFDPATLYPTAVIEAAKEQEQATGRRNLASVLTDDVLAIWDRWNSDGMSMNAVGKKANNGLIELAGPEVGRYLRKYRERQEEAATDTLPQPETAVAPPAPAVEPVAKKPRLTGPGGKAVVVKKAVIDDTPAPTPAPAKEPETAVAETAVIEPAPEPVAEAATEAPAADPLPKPEIEALETAPTVAGAAPFAVERAENLPPWLDRQWAPAPPAPRPGDALAALAALVNNEQIRVRGSVKLNLEIEFGD